MVKQILSILKSQIETKKMFNFIGVLTFLRHYCLQTENLDQIITMAKNFPIHPHFNCKKKVDVIEYVKAKASLADDNYDLIERVE
jgi:hypothetical protein